MTNNEKNFLKGHLSFTRYYLEYGSGLSTKIANQIPAIHNIVSVETDTDFWNREIASDMDVKQSIADERIIPQLIDIGKTGSWGYPLNEEKKQNWPLYANEPYRLGIQYDLVLIDGRFRIACTLQACLNADPSVKILIHDYFSRPHYHILEYFLEETGRADDMILFRIKESNKKPLLKLLLDKYQFLPEY